jgi:hypothetical protein
MHLEFIDRPFVPHNLISTQESPVPLQEQTWNLNALWVQELNPDILSCSLKNPGRRNSSRFPNTTRMERDARLQDIMHISLKPH